jgi:hypothetical protein
MWNQTVLSELPGHLSFNNEKTTPAQLPSAPVLMELKQRSSKSVGLSYYHLQIDQYECGFPVKAQVDPYQCVLIGMNNPV